MLRLSPLVILPSLAFCACTAVLGGSNGDSLADGGATDSSAPTSFECNPALAMNSPAWLRLTHRQFERTLRDLLRSTLGDEQGLAVFGRAMQQLAQLPTEQRFKVPQDLHGSYRRLSQDVDQGHVDGWYALALKVGQELTAPQNLATTVGSCATDVGAGTVAECVRDFVVRFGAKALRRPLAAEEVDFFVGFYGTADTLSAEGFADVVGGLLNAPEFLYRIEHGTDEPGERPGSVRLSGYELASRLSYHFWDTMPDDELFAKAESGALFDRAEYEREVDRLLADPRATETAREFFRDWLKLEDLPALDQLLGRPVFDAFVGDSPPTALLRENMINEVLDLLEYHAFREPGGVREIFTSDLLLPTTTDLAAIYDVPASDADTPVSGEHRPGLLTRAAFLATGTANTRPILKGVFIRTNLLCDPIPAPPDNAAATPPDISPTQTTREVVEELTEETGSNCATCHEHLLNPLGFATESYDALGRYRREQILFDESGAVLGTAPIDTSTSVNIGGETYELSGPDDLMEALVTSGKLEACLSRHYFRYSFGRWEDLDADGCALETMRQKLIETGSLAGMLREVALTPEFAERNFD